MLNNNICLIASFFDTTDEIRKFISSSDIKYEYPKLLLQTDELSLNNYIAQFLNDYTNVNSPETIYPQLITVKKYTDNLDLVYSVQLPINTSLKNSVYFLQTYNVAIIDAYVRKAIQYI